MQSKPYRETFIINKLACVGHIKKTFRLSPSYIAEGKKLSGGKSVWGKHTKHIKQK